MPSASWPAERVAVEGTVTSRDAGQLFRRYRAEPVPFGVP